MTVSFYLHTPLPDNLNERRALIQVTRLLYKQESASESPYTLIANIDTQKNALQLPQLDALLLGPKFAAILEFKSYFDPIIGQHLTGNWFASNRKGRQQVRGGSYRNPFLQAKNARQKWQDWLSLPLNVFVLFYPYLHPQSKLPVELDTNYWFSAQSHNKLKTLLISTVSPDFEQNASQQHHIATNILHSKKWNLKSLLTQIAGYLHVLEPGQLLVRYPVYPLDSFTIGRSTRVNNRVRLHSPQISAIHAHLFMQDDELHIEDLSSKNGIYINNQRQDGYVKMHANQAILLGTNSPDAPRIWFTPFTPPNITTKTLPTY